MVVVGGVCVGGVGRGVLARDLSPRTLGGSRSCCVANLIVTVLCSRPLPCPLHSAPRGPHSSSKSPPVCQLIPHRPLWVPPQRPRSSAPSPSPPAPAPLDAHRDHLPLPLPPNPLGGKSPSPSAKPIAPLWPGSQEESTCQVPCRYHGSFPQYDERVRGFHSPGKRLLPTLPLELPSPCPRFASTATHLNTVYPLVTATCLPYHRRQLWLLLPLPHSQSPQMPNLHHLGDLPTHLLFTSEQGSRKMAKLTP